MSGEQIKYYLSLNLSSCERVLALQGEEYDSIP